MRVIIYNGNQNPTTFVNALTVGLAKKFDYVAMAGKANWLTTKLTDNNVHLLPTGSNNKYILLLQFAYLFITIGSTKRQSIMKILSDTKIKDKITYFTLYASLWKQQPDIVHIQWVKAISLFRPLLEQQVNWFKIIVSFRGHQINIGSICNLQIKKEFSELLPLVDGFHAVSGNILNNAKLLGITDANTRIIYPAVSQELLSFKLNRTVSATLRILSVGRDSWKKGYRVSIDAMKILRDKGIDFHYTIVAGGEKKELKYQIHDLNLEQYITLIDNIPHKKVFELHANSDLFLLPSFEEGVANVVLEAMALGTPVISTNCGGMEEVIGNGCNGFIVPIRDANAIADAIIHFNSLPEKDRLVIVGNAKNTIIKHHLLDNQICQMVELYNQTING